MPFRTGPLGFVRLGLVSAGLVSLALVSLVPCVAFADSPVTPEKSVKTDKPAVQPPTGMDPENMTGISESMLAIVKGNGQMRQKNVQGAVESYRKALQLEPKNALAAILLGEALIARESFQDAEASFKGAIDLATGTYDRQRGRALFSLADVYERQKKWPEAITAWQAYNDWASRVGSDGGAFPKNGAERQKAVEAIVRLQKDYEAVRARIAQNKADEAAKKK